MTLRLRLLLAGVIILVVSIAGAIALLRAQEAFLVDQVDERLEQSRPFVRPVSTAIDDLPARPPLREQSEADNPVSNLFVGAVVDGSLETILAGQLLDDTPDVADRLDDIDLRTDGTPFTVSGVETETSFRVAVVVTPDSDELVVLAFPLDEVDSTVNQLRLALGLGIALIAGVLLLAAWWIERLGLRPIERLTVAADAVARGDRQHRAEVTNPHTEAGRLADAFNVMLDERDASEERLRQFVADVSHELRTPLTSIRGYLDLYREGGFRDAGDLDDVIRRMSHESNRMHDLIEDLLLLANLDQHRPLRHERVDLEAILRDIASDAQVLQPTRPVDVAIVAPEGGVIITGDHFRLQQVLAALVANALAYTDPDAGLHLAARTSADHIVVTVADSGPGLDVDDAARAFDRFFRAEPSRARRTGGSGLGLAIVKSIVEAHGGTITLDTAPGHGCRFQITLPQAPSAATVASPT